MLQLAMQRIFDVLFLARIGHDNRSVENGVQTSHVVDEIWSWRMAVCSMPMI